MVRYVGTVRFQNKTEVLYAGTVRTNYQVRSTQIINVPYRTAILGDSTNIGLLLLLACQLSHNKFPVLLDTATKKNLKFDLKKKPSFPKSYMGQISFNFFSDAKMHMRVTEIDQLITSSTTSICSN